MRPLDPQEFVRVSTGKDSQHAAPCQLSDDKAPCVTRCAENDNLMTSGKRRRICIGNWQRCFSCCHNPYVFRITRLATTHSIRRKSACHQTPLRLFVFLCTNLCSRADQWCCSAASQCSRNSLLNSRQRSSGKKILASLNSTRRRVPGMFSANQRDHFTSKYTSSVPQTISVGAFRVLSRSSTASVCLLSNAPTNR